MKILVTGGAGFIGSNIVQRALAEGFDVRVLDDLSVGSLSNLPENSNMKFIRGDCRDERTIETATRDIDYVFHEAAASSSPMFVPDPREGLDINMKGFLNVLHFSWKNKVKKVIYAMTSSAYGNAPVPWREQDLSLAICPTAYAYSLLARSFFGKLYSEKYGLRTLGLIYFSVYGPHERAKGRYANIISQFLWSIKKGEHPVLYGDGLQSRDFIYVSDVVEANFLAATSECSGGVFNVGTGVDMSMRKVAELLAKYMNVDIKPICVENPIPGYCYHTLADTRRAEKTLGFKAKVPLEEGLRSLIKFYS